MTDTTGHERGEMIMSTTAGPKAWHKSTFSGAGINCVEVAVTGPEIAVRDSKDRGGPVLRFTPGEWRAFLAGIRAGEFDC
jgi:Domain of unknown function (DUF397)